MRRRQHFAEIAEKAKEAEAQERTSNLARQIVELEKIEPAPKPRRTRAKKVD